MLKDTTKTDHAAAMPDWIVISVMEDIYSDVQSDTELVLGFSCTCFFLMLFAALGITVIACRYRKDTQVLFLGCVPIHSQRLSKYLRYVVFGTVPVTFILW